MLSRDMRARVKRLWDDSYVDVNQTFRVEATVGLCDVPKERIQELRDQLEALLRETGLEVRLTPNYPEYMRSDGYMKDGVYIKTRDIHDVRAMVMRDPATIPARIAKHNAKLLASYRTNPA